jgi:hypothetical protein
VSGAPPGCPYPRRKANVTSHHGSCAIDDPVDTSTESEQAAAEIDRLVAAISADLVARQGVTQSGDACKASRRFASAAAAQLSEATDAVRSAAGQLSLARVHILEAVAAAEVAGFTVHNDLSVTGAAKTNRGSTQAVAYEAAIQAAAGEFVGIDTRMASQLRATVTKLRGLGDV